VKRFVAAMLVLGVVLLGVVVARTDLGEVVQRLVLLGPGALAAIFAVFLLGHVALAGSWLITLPGAPFTPRWLYGVWKVLMVGSALESVTPFAGLGGEPVKAILLKRHYGIRYTAGAASLVLTRMTDLFAQVAFIAIGLALLFRAGHLPLAYRWTAAGGMVLMLGMVGGFLLVQTERGFSRLRAWLERGWLGEKLSGRAVAALDAAHEVEDQLVDFYDVQRGRVAASSFAAFLEWTGNGVAVWITVNALGSPIGFDDALVIEAFLALVRTTFFFVPGDLGTQEAAQVMICGAITGSPETGLALATVRRARDLLWIAWGLAIGGGYSLRDVTREAAAIESGAQRPD
jgi:uncharacterized protein (TIRG00374 family)